MSPAPISDQLRALIKARGISAYALGRAADVAPSVVSRFLSGERGLTLESLDRIAGALGLELRETRRRRG